MVEKAAAPKQAPALRGRRGARRRAAEADEEDEGEAALVPMLECNGCLRGFHLDCLRPPLDAVPKVCRPSSVEKTCCDEC